MNKVQVEIHVYIIPNTKKSRDEIIHTTCEYLEKECPVFMNKEISHFPSNQILSESIQRIVIKVPKNEKISRWQAELVILPYTLIDQVPDREYIDDDDDSPTFELWNLPNKYIDGLWESIITDPDIKKNLLGYSDSSIRFSKANIDSTIISWNRMALLYGPPGTGKTTICKALAQQCQIRHNSEYKNGVLLEINSHTLFSKFFSESGKLVMKMFDHIEHIAQQDSTFVYILIDEVESIAAARKVSHQNNEPGDAMRAVNAVLTSLDSLKRHSNVLVFCTSNMLEAIDPAFRDRLDMTMLMDLPPASARYDILRSCIFELMDKKLVQNRCREGILNLISIQHFIKHILQVINDEFRPMMKLSDELNISSITDSSTLSDVFISSPTVPMESPYQHLCRIAVLTDGMSGRELRRLPLKVFSSLPTASKSSMTASSLLSLYHYLVILEILVKSSLHQKFSTATIHEKKFKESDLTIIEKSLWSIDGQVIPISPIVRNKENKLQGVNDSD